MSEKLKEMCVFELNEAEELFFSMVHEQFSREIYNFLVRSGLPSHDADDMVQEVFIALLNHIKKVMKYDHPEAWLRKTAINRLKHNFRSRNRKRTREQSLEELTTEPPVYESGFDDVEQPHPNLTPVEAEMVKLKDRGYTEKEISEQMKMSYGACRMRFSRLRTRLRDWWDGR